MTMKLENTHVIEHREIQGGYRLLVLRCPLIAPEVNPGQFVHLRISGLDSAVLRRPFSVYKADEDRLSILYKTVGRGTEYMKRLMPDDEVSLLGPLGNGFPKVESGRFPVLVAGGYGMAALYLQARRSAEKGIVFVGGRTAGDILCVDEFKALGWTVEVATEDGSFGVRGLVTDAIHAWLENRPEHEPEFFVCGPNGMLEAIGELAIREGWKAWLSMDRHMGCGVGACLACVQKIKRLGSEWAWARVCREGPVFECRQIVWEKQDEA